MAIDRLSSTAALIAALRSDSTRKSSAGTSSKSAAKDSARSASGRPSIAQLRLELGELLKDVAVDDAVAIRQVRPRVVKSILLWEFGASLREHPEWRPMVDTIIQTLEGDPNRDKKFVALVQELKGRK